MTAVIVALTLAVSPAEMDTTHLYRALFVRAAPGTLLEVIDMFKGRKAVHEAAGDMAPFIMRHSQGDQWDLMLLYPMGSLQEFYATERISRRRSAATQAGQSEAAFQQQLGRLVAWREELFVLGPSLDLVAETLRGGDYYHLEIFLALPGKHAELLQERQMENAYLAQLGRPQNLIFVRSGGASWDAFTLGVYRDLKHYAESADIPEERANAAALAAGFEGSDRIGTYLRTLIQYHHDTLGSAVRYE